MAIALYHVADCAQCDKARLALALECLDYESLEIASNDREEVRKISGQTQVPVLVEEDGSVIVEANRILQHLASAEGSRLLPPSRRDRALTWVLVDRADAVLGPLCEALARPPDVEQAPSEDDRRALTRRLHDELTVLDGVLERETYLFGERPTVADVAVQAQLDRLPIHVLEPLLDDVPRVAAWRRQVAAAARGAPGR